MPETVAGVTRLLRGARHFTDEALRTLRASAAMLDAAGLDVDFIVTGRHGEEATFKRCDGAPAIEIVEIYAATASRPRGGNVQNT